MESTTNLSRTESIVDFETPAILHSLRDHKDLRAEDLRRESLIKIKVEKKMFKNQPICKFARDLVSQSGVFDSVEQLALRLQLVVANDDEQLAVVE
ncbi:hypothetical protein P7C71_g4943, partial [Lecanoromycetidae sp. Uapishka_2]